MKKADLRSGMIVENRGGKRGIVFLGTSNGNIIGGLGGEYEGNGTIYHPFDSFDEDLNNNDIPDSDIMKIYQPTSNMNHGTMDLGRCNKVWEREEEIELSFEEVANRLGIDPELLKIIKK